MELTGKCKEDFEKWFKDKYLKLDSSFCNRFFNKRIFTPNAMRYGVYVDFFDSVDINLTVSYDSMISAFNWWVESANNYSGKKRSRPEARTAAIQKANELYNL
jgi:hypothetical protein